MNFFKKLPKEKRNNFIMAVLAAVAVLAALGFGLIKSQYRYLQKLADSRTKASADLFTMEKSIERKNQVKTELAEVAKNLSGLEASMPSAPDAYSWIISTVRSFRNEYNKVEITVFGPSATVEDMNLFPKFPYKQATLNVSGKAHYHDLGLFLAEFENRFPYLRVLNLDLRLNAEAGVGEKEKIAFSMDIVTLVKSTP
jgi:Tfp pilus assembly protein PilO